MEWMSCMLAFTIKADEMEIKLRRWHKFPKAGDNVIADTALSFILKKKGLSPYIYCLSFLEGLSSHTNKWVLQKNKQNKQTSKQNHNTVSQVMLCGKLDKMELAMFSTSTAHNMILLKNYTAS